MLVHLTSYLCKPKHTISELMKKVAKERQREDTQKQLRSIQNIFLKNKKSVLMK